MRVFRAKRHFYATFRNLGTRGENSRRNLKEAHPWPIPRVLSRCRSSHYFFSRRVHENMDTTKSTGGYLCFIYWWIPHRTKFNWTHWTHIKLAPSHGAWVTELSIISSVVMIGRNFALLHRNDLLSPETLEHDCVVLHVTIHVILSQLDCLVDLILFLY